TGSEEPSAPRPEALGLLGRAGRRPRTRDGAPALWRDARPLRNPEGGGGHQPFYQCHSGGALWGAPGRRVRPVPCAGARPRRPPAGARRPPRPPAAAYTVPTAELGAGLRRPFLVLPPLVGSGFVPAADRAGVQRALGLTAPVVGMVSTFQASRRHGLGLAAFAR